MNVYALRLKHDTGSVWLRVVADSADAAIRQVCAIEGAPERSVREVRLAGELSW